MQLRFTHRALESQQETIIEVSRMVDPIFIQDEAIGQRADLQ